MRIIKKSRKVIKHLKKKKNTDTIRLDKDMKKCAHSQINKANKNWHHHLHILKLILQI